MSLPPISHRYEWNAYAFDFANEDYLEYMYHLAKKQAEDFSLTGTRIDAVMGSLPNWSPYKNNRPSQTGLYGGAQMTKAIRGGIKAAGKTPLVLPENNNPTPYFAPYTDLFYDMPFYRVTLDSRKEGLNEQEFAATLAHWLKAEQMSAPKGMQFGRFLENHDTVAPWYSNFDGARAVEVYGLKKARALWVLLSTIDGAPIVYENDEIGNEDFFTQLLAMRKEQFYPDNSMGIEYYNNSNSGIIAYRRYDGQNQKLVLVNLTEKEETRDFSQKPIGGIALSSAKQTLVYGDAVIVGNTITLPPYGYGIIDLQGGDKYVCQDNTSEFLVKNIISEQAQALGRYEQDIRKYTAFVLTLPDFTPAAQSEVKATYDPVEDYSAQTPDGPVWKYMYYAANKNKLDFCQTAQGNASGVWRAYRKGSGEWDFEWAGVGRNSAYYPANRYFELDTNMGAQVYGLLVFVAPKEGLYTLPSFELIGVGEGFASALVTLKNGEFDSISPMLYSENAIVRTDEKTYRLKAGETLSFYLARADNKYAFAQMNNMQIHYQELE